MLEIVLTYEAMCDNKNDLIGVLINRTWKYYTVIIILTILLTCSIVYILKSEWDKRSKMNDNRKR